MGYEPPNPTRFYNSDLTPHCPVVSLGVGSEFQTSWVGVCKRSGGRLSSHDLCAILSITYSSSTTSVPYSQLPTAHPSSSLISASSHILTGTLIASYIQENSLMNGTIPTQIGELTDMRIWYLLDKSIPSHFHLVPHYSSLLSNAKEAVAEWIWGNSSN